MADDKKFTEDAYEQTLIALFRDELGYAYECGYEVERNYKEPFYRADLVASMRRLNPQLPADAMDEGIKQITNISIGTLEQNNEQFTLWMQNGLEVGFLQDGEERTALMKLIDFDHPERNLFKVVNQWRVEEYKNKRCDMVVMVNGLPLVVVELKSAISEDATIDDAYKQIKNYQQSVPSLFSYNAFNVISDMSETRAGTITAKLERYMEWKTVDGSYESTLFADYRTFFLGMFQQQRLLDILQNFICFDKNQGKYAKILTAYHQYYAVGKALQRTRTAVEGNGKIGVFWHTQGSGKSLSMVFYAHQLVGVEHHGEALARTLRVPEHADFSVAFHCGTGALQGFAHGVVLMIGGKNLGVFALVLVEADEVLQNVEQSLLLEHAEEEGAVVGKEG